MLPFISEIMHKIKIKKEVRIKDGKVLVDNSVFFQSETTDSSAFLKEVYKSLSINYSKFYKMDLLSKLGFLAAEILLSDTEIDEDMAIICANNSSSLNTDIKYQNSIQEVPSPALFVYTLPNIVIGEISIRHKIYGEHMFFIQPAYNRDFILNYINELFKSGVTTSAIAAWVEVDGEGAYEARFELCMKELLENGKGNKEKGIYTFVLCLF